MPKMTKGEKLFRHVWSACIDAKNAAGTDVDTLGEELEKALKKRNLVVAVLMEAVLKDD